MLRVILTLLLYIFLIASAWNSLFLLPVKWLVVFFHESSHAIATVLTGGSVKSLQIVPQQGGHVISMGGNRFISLSAGYLGSLLCGLSIIMITAYTRKDHWLTATLGVVLMIITLCFADSLFSQMFGVISGGTFCLIARYLPIWTNDLVCRLVGLTSLLYVPLDIYDDTMARSYLPSDAAMLAKEFGGNGILWGALWLIISLVMIVYCLYLAIRLEVGQSKKYNR